MSHRQHHLRSHAKLSAERFIALIAPYCERVEIAGSIRRAVDPVKDIEIVAIPIVERLQAGLFGIDETDAASGPERDLLHDEVMRLVEDPGFPTLEARVTNGRMSLGDRTKYLVWQGIALDLFAVKGPSQWGAQLALRTGPAKFNQLLVTSRADRGALPFGIYQHQGALWKGDPKRGGQVIPTPEEDDWFRKLGVPCWKPHERTAQRLRQYLDNKKGAS